MDLVTLSFYAGVCGLLGLAGPRLGAAPVRLVVGAIVGVVAVFLLPVFRSFFG